MSIVSYIIEFLFCSTLFMALYKLLLEGRVSYRLARIYLVWSMVLAAVIPVLELPLYPAETIYYQIPIMESYEADAFDFVEDVAYTDNTERLSEKSASIDWARFFVTLFWIIYAVVVMMNLAFVAWRLWQIKRLRDGAELAVYENYVLAVSDQVKSPFAFWRTILLNRLYDGRKREQVILHELSHICHNHTAERMMLEFMRCIFWFNPFVWYAGSSLEQVQEWQADSDVLREGYDVTEYRLLIFQQIFGCSIDITSGLYNKVTKKRFLMMTKFNRGRFSFIRVCAVIPILVGMVFAFGSVRAESEINVVESEPADNVAQTAANGKETTIEEPNEVHHPNLSAPTVSDSGKVTEKPAIGGIIEQNTGKSVSDQDATLHIAADGKISLNGKTVALADLESALRENKPAMVVISADKGVNMGQLADVRQILRNANVLRVKYINGNNNQSSPIVLPPAPQNLPYGIKPLDEITDAKIPERNICRVLVNKNGKILRILMDMDNGYEVKRSAEIPIDNLDMLAGLVTEFLEQHRAYTSTEKATLSTGKSVEVPMYEGIISLEYDVQAPYDVCVAVREAIAKVFYDIRNQLVSGWFGPNKSIDNLSEADRSVVVRAVPLKIREAEPRGEEYTPSPKESKADNPATSDKESDYRIPYGMYSPSGYDTRWEWTKLSQEKMEEVFEHVPAISIISSDELEVYLRREVDFIKAGKYKYRVVGDELFLSNESGESYKFPLTLTIKEGLVEMILGIKAKVAGVKLKEVTMLSELKK